MAYYEPGRYLAKVIKQGFGRLQNTKKTPYFYLTVHPQRRVVEEDADGNVTGTERCNNEQYRDVKFFLTEKSIDMQVELLRGLGWGGDSFSTLEPGDVEYHSFIGLDVSVVCEHTEYNGKFYDNFSLSSANRGHNATPTMVSDLDEQFGEILRSTATAAPLREEPASKDSIPF